MNAASAVALTLLAGPGQEPAEPVRPAIEKKVVQAGPVTLHYLTVPWGPNTFAAMERGGDSFYAKRTWPFARMETTLSVTLERQTLPAGNHALVFHPNTPDNKGMSLEVRRIAVEEFLVPGNVMTRTPEGETVAQTPAVFETEGETAPTLLIELQAALDGARLLIRYGDRRLVRELRFRPASPSLRQ